MGGRVGKVSHYRDTFIGGEREVQGIMVWRRSRADGGGQAGARGGRFQGSGDPIPGPDWGKSLGGGSAGMSLGVAFFSINIIMAHVSHRPLDSG